MIDGDHGLSVAKQASCRSDKRSHRFVLPVLLNKGLGRLGCDQLRVAAKAGQDMALRHRSTSCAGEISDTSAQRPATRRTPPWRPCKLSCAARASGCMGERGTHRGIASQWLGRERHNTTSAQAEATCSLPRDTGRVARRRSLAVGQTAGTNRRQPTKPAAPTR